MPNQRNNGRSGQYGKRPANGGNGAQTKGRRVKRNTNSSASTQKSRSGNRVSFQQRGLNGHSQRQNQPPNQRQGQRPNHRPANSTKGIVTPPGATVHRIGPEHGIDLAHFIAEIGSGLSVRSVRRSLDKGICWVNGRIETYGSRKLYRGDIVAVLLPGSPGAADHSATWQLERKRVLVAESDLIVYDKPAGMPVTPTDAGKTVNLLSLLQDAYGEVHAVHRLDQDTSGVVLFARDENMKRLLETAFRDHAVQKPYLALVRDVPRERGERDTYLKLIERGKGWERWGTGKGQGAVQAVTTWQMKRIFCATRSTHASESTNRQNPPDQSALCRNGAPVGR